MLSWSFRDFKTEIRELLSAVDWLLSSSVFSPLSKPLLGRIKRRKSDAHLPPDFGLFPLLLILGVNVHALLPNNLCLSSLAMSHIPCRAWYAPGSNVIASRIGTGTGRTGTYLFDSKLLIGLDLDLPSLLSSLLRDERNLYASAVAPLMHQSIIDRLVDWT